MVACLSSKMYVYFFSCRIIKFKTLGSVKWPNPDYSIIQSEHFFHSSTFFNYPYPFPLENPSPCLYFFFYLFHFVFVCVGHQLLSSNTTGLTDRNFLVKNNISCLSHVKDREKKVTNLQFVKLNTCFIYQLLFL